jgi:hypothetical protein
MAWDVNSLKDHFDALRAADQTAVQAALAAQEKAIIKAEAAAERRFELLNELRQGVATKEQLQALEKEMAAITERLTRGEGQKQGSEVTIGKIIAIVGISITVLGFVMGIVVMAANGKLG